MSTYGAVLLGSENFPIDSLSSLERAQTTKKSLPMMLFLGLGLACIWLSTFGCFVSFVRFAGEMTKLGAFFSFGLSKKKKNSKGLFFLIS